MKNWPKAKNISKVIVSDGYNSDIVSGINGAFFTAAAQARGMAQAFKGANRLASAFNIWSWVKNNVNYKRDPDELQMIKLPGRILQDKEGDCKSFTLLCGSLLMNLGMPVVIRYVSYNASPTPTHVYCYTFDKDGSPIIVDAVHNKFNSELPFKHKRDFLMKIKSN